jgi:hypothetical protein
VRKRAKCTHLVDHAVAGPFSGVLDGVFIGLGQAPTGTIKPSDTLAAITEADFDGYARLALTWKGPYIDPAGAAKIQADGNYFACTDATKPNQITSMFVADALTAGNLLFSEVLPGGPIWMNALGNAFSLSVLFQLPVGVNYGDVVVIQ